MLLLLMISLLGSSPLGKGKFYCSYSVKATSAPVSQGYRSERASSVPGHPKCLGTLARGTPLDPGSTFATQMRPLGAVADLPLLQNIRCATYFTNKKSSGAFFIKRSAAKGLQTWGSDFLWFSLF